MRLILFRCPTIGLIANGQADDPRPGEASHTCQPVHCTACKGSHLVDPTTGDIWLPKRNSLLIKPTAQAANCGRTGQ